MFVHLSQLSGCRIYVLAVLVLLVATLGAPEKRGIAQTTHFSGSVQAVGSGFGSPFGAAVDSKGNVFLADVSSSRVYEIVAVNGTISSSSQVLSVGSGFFGSYGVAVDLKGNVFVADSGNNAVKEIVAVNGSVSSTSQVIQLGSGFNYPEGVAVDLNGDVFVADYGHGAVKEIVAVNGSVSSTSQIIQLGSGFIGPSGVAVDLKGNVFVADFDINAVKEIVAVNGSVSATSQVIQLGSGFVGPVGVAVDLSDNVFVADFYSSTVKEIMAANGTVSSTSPVITLGSGFSSPNGVAVDARGNVFVADLGKKAVKEIELGAVDFGSVDVGSTGTTVTLNFTLDAAGSLNAATPYQVVTQGATGLDFADAGGGSCDGSTTYSAGDTCTVNVNLTPRYPGLRMGAVVLYDAAGAPMATGHLRGIGVGPQVLFPGNTKTDVVSSAFNAPWGVAVDSSGNVFVADIVNSAVKEIVAVNGAVSSNSTVITVGSGFSVPNGVAVDSGGNVFVANLGNNTVKEIVAVNGAVSSNSTVKTVGSGFSWPYAVAVDGSGNVFVADTNNSAVKEIVAVNGAVSSNSTVITVGSGFGQPTGVAVDGGGNVFVADPSNSPSTVMEIVADNGTVSSSSTVITVGSGFNSPVGVAVDGNGNVIVADAYNSAVKEILAVNGMVSSTSTVLTVGSWFNYPSGVAADSNGNILVVDSNNNALERIDLATPPALGFAATSVGIQSSDSPQSVMVANIGNAALSFPIPLTGKNPSIAQGYQLDSTTTCPELSTSSFAAGTLEPGSICTYAIDFLAAAGGTNSGSLTLTDNNRNAASPNYATQSVGLTGTGVLIPLLPGSLSAGTVATAYTQTFTASGGTAPYSFAVTGGTLPAGLSLTSAGVLSGMPTAGGLFSFTIAATDANRFIGSKAYSLTVNAPTLALSPSSLVSTSYNTSYRQTLSASGGTASYIFVVTSGSLPAGLGLSSAGVLSGTAMAAGTFYFTVTATDSSSGTGPYSAVRAFSLVVTPAGLSITANNATRLYGTANPSFSGSVTGAVHGDSFTESFFTTAIPSSNVGAYLIVPSVTGTNLAGYSVGIQNGTLTITKAASSLVLASSRANATVGANVTFTATVSSRTSGTPTGTVQFLNGSMVLGNAALNAQGVAVYTLNTLTAGSHSISAVYAGDQNFTTSSSFISQQVTAPDYILAVNPNSLVLKAGETGSATLTLTPMGGFTGALTFSCNDLPANASCSFSPASLTMDGSNSAQTLILTVTTVAAKQETISIYRNKSAASRPLAAGILFLPGLLAGAFLYRGIKKLPGASRLALMLLFLAAIGGVEGCGSTPSNAVPDMKMVIVTASQVSNGSIGHTLSFPLTITQ